MSKPFGNGRSATPTAFTPVVIVTLFGFIVVGAQVLLNPRWMKVETGTPVELLAGPVMLTSNVGATVSTVIAFVETAVWLDAGPANIGRYHLREEYVGMHSASRSLNHYEIVVTGIACRVICRHNFSGREGQGRCRGRACRHPSWGSKKRHPRRHRHQKRLCPRRFLSSR